MGGPSIAKRFICCAENLTAARAKDFGMVDEVVENAAEGHARVKKLCEVIRQTEPRSVQACKNLIVNYNNFPISQTLVNYLCGVQTQHLKLQTYEAGSKPAWVQEEI